ncbi:hypothetical protein EYF80_038747 [Liparis tanakae]|uniref:Uncharacterized protein n=1 Tax=Liparis tanakae TaxID=230148 RepID=A0A4Z2GBV0_9TELE|nr:hypothetical protein EYF80_038747 [Liparis tanakae]
MNLPTSSSRSELLLSSHRVKNSKAHFPNLGTTKLATPAVTSLADMKAAGSESADDRMKGEGQRVEDVKEEDRREDRWTD